MRWHAARSNAWCLALQNNVTDEILFNAGAFPSIPRVAEAPITPVDVMVEEKRWMSKCVARAEGPTEVRNRYLKPGHLDTQAPKVLTCTYRWVPGHIFPHPK